MTGLPLLRPALGGGWLVVGDDSGTLLVPTMSLNALLLVFFSPKRSAIKSDLAVVFDGSLEVPLVGNRSIPSSTNGFLV